MSKPLKIAYIIDAIETPSAGTEKQLLTMLHGLDRQRVEPYLVCLHDSEWMQSQQFDFPFVNLNVHSLFGLPFLKGLRKFKQLHKQEQFDIVQTFFKDGNIFGTFAARYARCPVVISSRRNTGYWHDHKHIRMLRFLRRWTTLYLANSQAAALSTCEIELVDKDRTAVIYNALDLERFMKFDRQQRGSQREKWNVGDDEILVGAIANLRPVKKLDTLIE
ncbi:MAG TPA: glycosyltransferase, partial [candidate division Zixibacteria bacterium]|nr:glycosyltransferase [candidate division Zixibacteria bacterium]